MATPLTALPVEPAWPDSGGRPLLFLLDASSTLERRILESWIERHEPPGLERGAVETANVPQSRRRRRSEILDPRLEAFLRIGDDPLLVPLRVVWMPPERDGERRVGLRDLLTLGDPRDPDPVRQHAIFRLRPERVRIVAAEGALASELRERWASPEGRGVSDGTSLGDYVALQAWLALERAERRLRGNRYKVPRFVAEDLTSSRQFAQGLAALSRMSDEPFSEVTARAQRYIREIAANHTPYAIDLVAGAIHWLMDKAYTGFHYDAAHLRAIYGTAQEHPLVFLPSHKSNFDHLVLQYALYENELPPNHTAGGINTNFFPVGPMIRRTGVFFIRRTFKDNGVYKFVLRSYIDYLLEKRFPMEWYIEGGRSRTGKLRAPRYGLLAYVVDSYLRSVSDDVVLVPVSIAYDQIQDVGTYAAEQRGAAKQAESFGWAFKAIRSLRRRYGAIHMRFGEPISLRNQLGQPDPDLADRHLRVQKLAFEVAVSINRATPITPISLVTLALLSAGRRALTVDETLAALEPFLDYVKRRELPTTEPLALDTPERVRLALDSLALNDVVARFEGATATVYGIGHEQHHAAAYYRNTVIHFFVNTAIAEVALLGAGHPGTPDPVAAFWDDCLRLRDLLKFEFFFSERQAFRQQVEAELALQDADWEAHLGSTPRRLLASFRPFTSPAVLKPFFEAYRIVADVIAAEPPNMALDADDVINRAVTLGRQYELRGQLDSAESVSKTLFGSAVALADNRNLLDADSTDRQAFADELQAVVDRLHAIQTLAASRDAGLLDE